MKRDSWGTQIGFIFAVAGSAIGLGNIWKFPYMAGKHGGGAFILLFALALLLIGFPVLMAEMAIGRSTQRNPSGAFFHLGGKPFRRLGSVTICIGFIVSTFYSAIAGWILGYFVESLLGHLAHFTTVAETESHFNALQSSSFWGVGFQGVFVLLACYVLYAGVRNGIERWNKILMPLLFGILAVLIVKGLSMPNSWEGVSFLNTFHWESITSFGVLAALGQAFFSLSVGQGTMVTYGSYLKKGENLFESCLPVLAMDVGTSMMASLAIFTIVFSAGLAPDSGPTLLFQTLPLAFSQMTGGVILESAFFFLVCVAALTSQISAMEPTIAYLVDEKRWTRHRAVVACSIGVFLFGIPSALSPKLIQQWFPFATDFLQLLSFVAVDILIPLGGLFALLLVTYRWGTERAIDHLLSGHDHSLRKVRWLRLYFRVTFRYLSPLLIVVILLGALFT